MQTRVEGKNIFSKKWKHWFHKWISHVLSKEEIRGKKYWFVQKQRTKPWKDSRWYKLGRWHIHLSSLGRQSIRWDRCHSKILSKLIKLWGVNEQKTKSVAVHIHTIQLPRNITWASLVTLQFLYNIQKPPVHHTSHGNVLYKDHFFAMLHLFE